MRFHSAHRRGVAQPPLAEIHRTFLARLWRARFLAAIKRRNRERVIDQHGKIVQALKARDRQAIRVAIGIHLDNLADDILQVISREIAAASEAGAQVGK